MPNHAETTMTEQAVAVVVYSKPKCVQCTATYRKLDKHHINYTVVDITQGPDAHEFVKALGYQQAPVTFVALPDGESAHWSGFDTKKIADHITNREDAA